MKLPIYTQPRKSITCGPYCVKMLLEHYGKKMPIKKILGFIPLYKGEGSWLGDNAYCLMENGVKCKVVTFGTEYYSPAEMKMSQKRLLESFEKRLKGKLKKNVRHRLKSLVRFMKEGGKVEVRIPSKKEVICIVKGGKPVMAVFDLKVVYGTGVGREGHYVILADYRDNKFQLHDPHWLIKGKKKWYDADKMMFAIYTNNGGFIQIQ